MYTIHSVTLLNNVYALLGVIFSGKRWGALNSLLLLLNNVYALLG